MCVNIHHATPCYTMLHPADVWTVSHVQLYVVLAQQRSTQEASKKDNHLQKAAETLEVTLTRLSPSDKEVNPLPPSLPVLLPQSLP